jgi:DNA-binding MarR family transcriptional regulator
MSASSSLQDCNCLAIRQAARHVSQFYDQLFAPTGLRATQFAILSRLRRDGPMTINALAAALVMDRTTLGRNILPLQRDGLIVIVASPADRRRRELRLSAAGNEMHRQASERWAVAQTRFDAVYGSERAATLRGLLREVVASEFAGAQWGRGRRIAIAAKGCRSASRGAIIWAAASPAAVRGERTARGSGDADRRTEGG